MLVIRVRRVQILGHTCLTLDVSQEQPWTIADNLLLRYHVVYGGVESFRICE
jgi:hypothetical protein